MGIRHERPGVYSSYETSGLTAANAGGGKVAVIAEAGEAEPGKVFQWTSYSRAAADVGECALSRLARIALRNGAGTVYGAAAGTDWDEAVGAVGRLEDVDVVAMLIDASQPIGRGDEWVAEQVRAAKGSAKICVLSKTDMASDAQISAQREAAEALCDWDAMVGLSSTTGRNVDAFVEEVQFLLPEGPAWFPADMETDQPLEVMVAEFIREKVLRNFFDEVPHAIGVGVEEMEFEKPNLYRIYAVIYVERDSQKGIIIGKRGAAIKRIGTEARRDLELLLGSKVFLDLSVKVRKNWRRDANQIRRFGYGEGA